MNVSIGSSFGKTFSVGFLRFNTAIVTTTSIMPAKAMEMTRIEVQSKGKTMRVRMSLSAPAYSESPDQLARM